MSDSLWPHGVDCQTPLSMGSPRDKNTEVGCCFPPQGIFPTRGLSPCLPHGRWILCGWALGEAPYNTILLSVCGHIFPSFNSYLYTKLKKSNYETFFKYKWISLSSTYPSVYLSSIKINLKKIQVLTTLLSWRTLPIPL